MIRAVESEPMEASRAVEPDSRNPENTVDGGVESQLRAEDARRRNELDRKAVEEWKKVYMDIYGS